MDEALCEIVRQCVENGVIKSDALTVDTTHIEVNCTKKDPERIMKHLAKRIFKALEADNGFVLWGITRSVVKKTDTRQRAQR